MARDWSLPWSPWPLAQDQQMHVSGIQKASVESVALLDYFFFRAKTQL